MKWNRKSFGVKLWLYFIFFAAVIFVSLWLLQTVFLQKFYNGMVIGNIKSAATQIVERQDSDDLTELIDEFASGDSLLIFLTDRQGNIIYSADEHHSIYQKNQTWHTAGDLQENPYRESDELMNWQMGAYRNLPQNYSDFLRQLSESESGRVGYVAENNTAYIYGMDIADFDRFGSDGAVLYISAPLGAVGATVDILRIQLVWVTLASLVIGFIIAYFIAKQFAGPISAISAQAKWMEKGKFDYEYKKGFCLELDELSETLAETAAALDRLENARRELMANISHDLRTPLTMIKGYAEIVKEISWADDQKREEDLAIIIRESDRLTSLVNDILDYSSMRSSDHSPDFKQMDLSAAARSVVDQFAPLCEQSRYKIEATLAAGQWVRGDEHQLKRVFYNLMDNAICHSGDDRKVAVTLKSVGDMVRVEVRDFGNGIAEEELPHIWDRYFTSKQRKNVGGRSGLGLAIAKEILLMHQANFGVESKLGQGCLFWFELRKMLREKSFF